MKFERLQGWCDEADRGLGETVEPDRAGVIDDISSGRAELYRVNGGESWLVLRIDRDELVIMCFKGRGAVELWSHLLNAVKVRGLRSVRFHTPHRALVRLARRQGFGLAEYVCRFEVK